ncbi:hypothetical protein GGU10DRAFT_177579 [Lentinula aff. detonsa]|uniref:rRNA-processing protein FYV7 n=1 Tax=Lentinula aff. detonsa TaxID=2804958 RepID=A0AA38KWM6_9AGAR|nr:hypothetical protein GGU10DRAFT_177579 [Lentinula aff. detonsa]
MVVTTETRKKKKPPSFKHYPAARAKSLKKAWVEKAKIKSKWKSERQKMELPSSSLPTETGNASEEENRKFGTEFEDDYDEGLGDRDERAETAVTPEPSVKPSRTPRPNPASTSQMKQTKDYNAQNLRDLTRTAYSRETLHTYKSDPLNRRGNVNGGRGNGRGGIRGRGQPNMKLRMGAMLEKIKRGFT